MNRALIPVAAVAASAVLMAQAPQSGRPPMFRSSADLVTVDVSVRDKTRVVTGLGAADFDVRDNGVRQEITDVSYGKLPIDVTVALDVSFSVSGPMLERLRRAVTALMSDLGRDDRLKLIMFNQQISRLVDFTDDAAAGGRAIRETQAGGGTSVFDAISVALASAVHPDRRQLVVVFTDGSDSYSVTEPAMLTAVAEHTNAAVMMVGSGMRVLPVVPEIPGRPVRVIVRSQTTLQAQRNRFYAKLATDTGGLVIPVTSDLTSTFRHALDEFRSSYVLYFAPQGVDRKGFHTLTVTVPANGKLTVRARRGYWGEGTARNR
jgi:VWFA-related protein